MNQSKGTLYFHRLFSVAELGFARDPEPIIRPLIWEFLKIGEAVAGRWIEMPQAVLILQVVPDIPNSGAIYLYDRRDHVFYMLCFDGEDDHLTLEDFEQLLIEYNLLQYAEQPALVISQPPMPEVAAHNRPEFNPETVSEMALTTKNCRSFSTRQGLRWHARPGIVHVQFQTIGTA